MKKTFLLFLFTVFTVFISLAQKSPFKFGEIDPKYLDLTHCPIDSSAGAMIIEEYGESTIDHNFEIIFLYHARIKFFDKTEFDRANISIPHGKGERPQKLRAVTYNMVDGKLGVSKVTKDQIFREDKNEYTEITKFTFPKVQEGSVIEYTYMVNYGDWTRLNTWYFQGSIPALYSQYRLDIPEYFHYKRRMTGYVPLKKAEVDFRSGFISGTSVRFQTHDYVAENVPAFEDEPFMDSKSNYISKIEFELNTVNIPGQMIKTYLPSSYIGLSKKLSEHESFGGKIKNTGFTSDIVDGIKDSITDQSKIAEQIYKYVQDHIKKDGDADYESLRKVLKEGKGSITDINLILTAALLEAGFEAFPVRLSTKSNGTLAPNIPIARKFNYTLCKLILDGETILLDGSNDKLPFGVIPRHCTNGQGLVISETNPHWVALTPYLKNHITYFGTFELNDDATVSGQSQISRLGYEGLDFHKMIQKEGQEEYKESYANNKDLWSIEDHEITELDDKLSVRQNITFVAEDLMDDLGEIIYLNPIVYGKLTENPFKRNERMFPVDFGAPYTVNHIYNFKIGNGLKVESLPPPLSLALPDNGGAILYQARLIGDQVSVTCKYMINKSQFDAKDYMLLKEFYARLVEKQGQQIVLKRE